MRLLTVREVAEVLRVSGSLVYQLIEQHRLPVHRVGNGRGSLRVSEVDLAAYIDACREGSLPPTQPQRRVRLNNLTV